jgi:L-histidine Nalpha-methyltransferase
MDMSLARAQQAAPPEESFADSVFAGLGKAPKEMACKYFYDQEGSQLFERICTLPEYYQTRTETLLLANHAGEIAQLMGEDVEIVEFGAGASQKVRILLDTGHVRAYSPLDISGDYLREVVLNLAADYPALTLRPLIGDFTRPLEIPALIGSSRRAGFFPGSTIGNFRPDAAMCLLRRMRGMLEGGGLLIGVDLVKDPARLHAAYNDRAGVTALFNKNLLARANRELGADFDLDAFAHYAPYSPAAHRIEMYLVSLKRQSVNLMGQRFDFAAGEAIHTEDSHKYTIESFREMAARAGFRPRAVWTDPERLFSLHWLES